MNATTGAPGEGKDAFDAEVGIVGAGYAGLSAALFLRRHRIGVLAFDGGPPRNQAATEVHGYLGLPAASARDLIAIGRSQVAELGGRIEDCRIERADVVEGGFRLAGSGRREWRVRRLLMATGVRDLLPDIERFDEFYGRSVHVCPHCDGYEWRDQPIAVISWNEAARDFVSKVSHWSRDVTLLSDGRSPELSGDDRAWLDDRGIALRTADIVRFEGQDGRLDGLRLDDGSVLPAAAAFFSLGEEHQTALAQQLAVKLDESGAIQVDEEQHTSVQGVWAAGDVAGDSQFVAIAAAHGVKAALDIHRTLASREPESHPA
ncbi:MAG: NAD(P)/FAD-dependent oxidoreductase [Chloroflexota bacterium]|nr:NAD(P)/FAD-dependent oxidoreductase [Chloroflexota bacterium]